MTAIAKRNLKIFFRDKSAVFFSVLGVLIIIGLYVLFLGDMMIRDLKDVQGARFLMDSWIIAGMLAVTSITTTMGAFGVMVDDKSKKILKDFSSSPLSRKSLAGGYILSTFAIGVIMSLISLVLGEIYIVANGGELLSVLAFVKVLGCIVLSVMASSALVFFIVSFFKSQNAFATASTIIGTFVGFLTGIYIPIGTLPAPVQFVVKIFPVSHSGVLFRQIMMQEPMNNTFQGASAQVIDGFKNDLGVVYSFNGEPVSIWISLSILAATIIVFYGLAILNVSRKSK